MNKTEAEHFSERLKWHRKKNLKISQPEIANHCGISKNQWVKIENGLEYPSFAVLLKLAELGADMNYLFGNYEINLSDCEEKIIKQYRVATTQGQITIEHVVNNIQKKTPEQLEEEKRWLAEAIRMRNMVVHRE